jgi:hypothetical protein
MTVTQSLVRLNTKNLSLYFCSFNPYGSTRHDYHGWEFFLMLGSMVFDPTHPKSKKIQTIGIQSRPDLKE